MIGTHHVNEQDGSMNVDDEGAEAEGGAGVRSSWAATLRVQGPGVLLGVDMVGFVEMRWCCCTRSIR